MKLLIAIPSNTGRDSLPFPMVQSIIKMILYFSKSHPQVKVDIHYFGGLRIDAVRNTMITYAINEKFDKVLFLDDDMIFPENMIAKLWGRHKPIVSGLYGSKSFPFHNFVMPIETEGHKWLLTVEPKLYQVKSIATGCLLIDLSVFDKLPRPWFLLRMDKFGRITATEDCFFGANCFNHGIEMFVDATIQCQHLRLVPFPRFFDHEFINYNTDNIRSNTPDDKVIQIHPTAGFLISDGIDDCSHANQRQIIVNDGEDEHFMCMDCGLITKGIGAKQMEKILDGES